MGRGKATYRESDLKKAMKLARPDDRIEIDLREHKIVIVPSGKPVEPVVMDGVGASPETPEDLKKLI